MAQKISRRKIANYVADGIVHGEEVSKLLRQAAAYLIDSKRTREADLLTRAIEDALEERGTTIATVTTARSLDDELRGAISALVGAKTVVLREIVDPTVLGGANIETPSSRLDATIKHKLTVLREAKQ